MSSHEIKELGHPDLRRMIDRSLAGLRRELRGESGVRIAAPMNAQGEIPAPSPAEGRVQIAPSPRPESSSA